MTAPRRRWSFGLRTMILGVAIVAGPLAWVGYALNWIRERHEFLENRELENLGRRWRLHELPIYTDAPGLLWLFGERGRENLLLKPGDDLPAAMRLFPEAKEASYLFREFDDR